MWIDYLIKMTHVLIEQNIVLNIWRLGQMAAISQTTIFKCILLNENVKILIKISLKFVSKGSVNNIPALVQIMAWWRQGDKPLSEAMMVWLLTHVCITWPQWVNICRPRQNGCHFANTIYVILWHQFHWNSLTMVQFNNNWTFFQMMAWHQTRGEPLSEPLMV